MEWKPIETAPKDGTAILVYWRFDTHKFIHPAIFIAGLWVHDWDRDESVALEPTHWMPIPEPPVDA